MNMEVFARRDLRFIVLIRFVDVITKAALSTQLFQDPEWWSGRGRTHDLPRNSPTEQPVLNNPRTRSNDRSEKKKLQVNIPAKTKYVIHVNLFEIYF